MNKARLALKVSITCFIVTFMLLLFNEGILSLPTHSDAELITKQQVRIWRGDCDDVSPVPNNIKPIVFVTGTASKLDYFASKLGSVIKLWFSAPTSSITPSWSFYSNCNDFGIDISDLKSTELLDVQAHVYNDHVPPPGQPRTINPQLRRLEAKDIGDGKYSITVPAALEIASLELSLGNLLTRLSASEYGIRESHLHVLFAKHPVDSTMVSVPDLINQDWFLGGTAGEFVATGNDQQTMVRNVGRQGWAPELVSKIWFDQLDAVKSFLTIFLSTLLGIWIGAIFESLLVLVTLNEIQSQREVAEKDTNYADNPNGNEPVKLNEDDHAPVSTTTLTSKKGIES